MIGRDTREVPREVCDLTLGFDDRWLPRLPAGRGRPKRQTEILPVGFCWNSPGLLARESTRIFLKSVSLSHRVGTGDLYSSLCVALVS